MVRIAGDLILVTKSPAAVTEVWIRPDGLRPHGGGLIVDDPDRVPVVGGFLEVDCVPGPAVITLVSHGVASRAVPIVVPDQETATLAETLDQIHDYAPPVVGRAQQFAREAGADRVGSAEQVGAWVGEAEVLRGDTVAAAERAETGASTSTEQAGLAGEHRQGAEDAEDAAHAAAGAAADATVALIRDEMDGRVAEAGQHAHLAGLSSQGAEASSVTAGQHAETAEGHAEDAGGHAQVSLGHAETALAHAQVTGADRVAVATDRGAVEQIVVEQIVPIGEQVASDRTAVAADRQGAEEARDVAAQHRDDAREAAENAQSGAPPGGWVREDMHVDVREDLSRARSALQEVPDATAGARGVIRLTGDLGGTATSPTVPGLASKSDAGHGHEIDDTEGLGAALSSAGQTAEWGQVSGRPTQFPPEGHRHPADHIDGLDALIDQRARALIVEASSTHLWDGEGTWEAPWWAGPDDSVINLDSGEVHSVEEING